MDSINKVKSISIWIFIVPFFAINACLILITHFHELFSNKDILSNTIPYFDGGASISRTARVFPTYLIFKPAMFLTAYLLIKYWIYNKKIVLSIYGEHNQIKKFLFFGIASAICLVLHSIFLGIKYDYDLYKLFRRLVLLGFIIFEIVAQALLVVILFKVKDKIADIINKRILFFKIVLVSLLAITALVSLPIVTSSGNTQFKHALEWNYFVGVVTFYLLTFLFWKKKKTH